MVRVRDAIEAALPDGLPPALFATIKNAAVELFQKEALLRAESNKAESSLAASLRTVREANKASCSEVFHQNGYTTLCPRKLQKEIVKKHGKKSHKPAYGQGGARLR